MTYLDIELMSGVEFEVFVAGVLCHNGYEVAFTRSTADFGLISLPAEEQKSWPFNARGMQAQSAYPQFSR
jgi:HJR/Mrr/RecB family endonuclease